MTILFHKTFTRIYAHSLFGADYQSEYIFSTLNQLPIATLVHVDFRAIIKFNDTVFRIEPDYRSWVYKYIIHEGNSVVGQMKMGGFRSPSITLSTGEIFKLTRQYKTIWERFVNKVYRIQLQSDDLRLFYEFEKKVMGSLEEKLIQTLITVSFFGIILIERLLNNEEN